MRKLKVWLFAGFLALMAPQAAQPQVSTTLRTITNASWQDLGVGPLLISPNSAIAFVIGDTAPTLPVAQGFKLAAHDLRSINTASHIWVVATGAATVTVFVAPVLGSAGAVEFTLTAGETPTSGFAIGELLASDGSKLIPQVLALSVGMPTSGFAAGRFLTSNGSALTSSALVLIAGNTITQGFNANQLLMSDGVQIRPSTGVTVDPATQTLTAASYRVGSTLGANCNGPPTANFAVSYGLITSC